MRTVMIEVPAIHLSAELAAMREWLDQQHCERYRFACNRYGKSVAIYFEFDKEADGKNFKSRSDNWDVASHPDILLEKEQDWLLRFSGGAADGNPRETMAQACWWRLKAEEARAEGEAFSSPSARQTMQIVAKAWDSMAEDLERRLSRKTG